MILMDTNIIIDFWRNPSEALNMHRPHNVDTKENLINILSAIQIVNQNSVLKFPNTSDKSDEHAYFKCQHAPIQYSYFSSGIYWHRNCLTHNDNELEHRKFRLNDQNEVYRWLKAEE